MDKAFVPAQQPSFGNVLSGVLPFMIGQGEAQANRQIQEELKQAQTVPDMQHIYDFYLRQQERPMFDQSRMRRPSDQYDEETPLLQANRQDQQRQYEEQLDEQAPQIMQDILAQESQSNQPQPIVQNLPPIGRDPRLALDRPIQEIQAENERRQRENDIQRQAHLERVRQEAQNIRQRIYGIQAQEQAQQDNQQERNEVGMFYGYMLIEALSHGPDVYEKVQEIGKTYTKIKDLYGQYIESQYVAKNEKQDPQPSLEQLQQNVDLDDESYPQHCRRIIIRKDNGWTTRLICSDTYGERFYDGY